MAAKRSSVQRFEDLRVWQEARLLTVGVYRACRTQALSRDWPLANQMKRAAVSVASNIAEGHERGSRVEYVQFCYIAKGSAGELRTQIEIARAVGLLDARAHTWLRDASEKVSSLLSGYIKHLQETQAEVRGAKFTKRTDRNREGGNGGTSPGQVEK